MRKRRPDGRFAPKHSRATVSNAIGMYVTGVPYEEIERKTGISRDWVKVLAGRRGLSRGKRKVHNLSVYSEEQVQLAVGMYEAGIAAATISKVVGMHQTMVSHHAKSRGVKLRRQAGYANFGTKYSLEDRAEAMALYACGSSFEEIENQTGLKRHSVNQFATKYGIRRRMITKSLEAAMETWVKLRELGAKGYHMHDLLVRYGLSDSEASIIVNRFYGGLPETGLEVSHASIAHTYDRQPMAIPRRAA